jgi:hypothetical protein
VFGAWRNGTLVAFLLQAYTNCVELPDVGRSVGARLPVPHLGKPAMSLPAFIPVMFELHHPLSALATVKLMFLFNGLPLLYHPLFTSNRFRRRVERPLPSSIEARDPKFLPEAALEEFLQIARRLSLSKRCED